VRLWLCQSDYQLLIGEQLWSHTALGNGLRLQFDFDFLDEAFGWLNGLVVSGFSVICFGSTD
jgi:hypothetical protein